MGTGAHGHPACREGLALVKPGAPSPVLVVRPLLPVEVALLRVVAAPPLLVEVALLVQVVVGPPLPSG